MVLYLNECAYRQTFYASRMATIQISLSQSALQNSKRNPLAGSLSTLDKMHFRPLSPFNLEMVRDRSVVNNNNNNNNRKS